MLIRILNSLESLKSEAIGKSVEDIYHKKLLIHFLMTNLLMLSRYKLP